MYVYMYVYVYTHTHQKKNTFVDYDAQRASESL